MINVFAFSEKDQFPIQKFISWYQCCSSFWVSASTVTSSGMCGLLLVCCRGKWWSFIEQILIGCLQVLQGLWRLGKGSKHL